MIIEITYVYRLQGWAKEQIPGCTNAAIRDPASRAPLFYLAVHKKVQCARIAIPRPALHAYVYFTSQNT